MGKDAQAIAPNKAARRIVTTLTTTKDEDQYDKVVNSNVHSNGCNTSVRLTQPININTPCLQ
ncbi:hypothetical protein HaLaN_33100, partial [Haematococcus lacustris]